MATSVDALQIEINARADSANRAINRLTRNLDRLSTSLNSLNVGNIKGLDKTLKNLANISNISSNGATNITNLARALSTLSANANNIPILNRSLSVLSGSLARFMATMATAPSVSANTLQMTQALAQLARTGNTASVTASNLANLGAQLRNFMQTMSTAPMVNQNTIQMTNALANLASQGSRVGRSSQSLVSGLNRTDRAMRTTTKHAKSLASAFGSFYANFFWVIRGAKALWSSIESTADYIEAYNYYNVAFGKIASEWKGYFNEELGKKLGISTAEEYAESFTGRMNETLGKLSGVQISVGADGKGLLTDTGMKNLGLNIQEVTQYASQLASVTNSLGQTGETSLAISTSFTKLAGDISSLFNVDYSTVAQNLQSGLIGQSRALYKYGIDITNATLQTYAYKLGLTKAVSEMTQAEKQQLRTIAILDQSKVSWGDLANTINSPSNMIRQLSTNLKEAGMVLGQLFIPMLEHVLPVVNGTTIAIKRLLTEIAGFFGIEIDLEKFGQGYNELEDETGDLSDSYDDLASSIEEVKSQLLGFDEVNKLSDTSATLSVGTEDNTIDLTDEIVSATEEYQKVWDEAFKNMNNTSLAWAGKIQTALDGVGKVFEDFAIGDFFKAGEDVSQLAIEFNNYISKAIDNIDSKAIGKKFADFILGIDYGELGLSLAKVVGSIFEAAWDFGWGIGEDLSKWLVDNNVEDFWDFGSALGGKELADKLMQIEKSFYNPLQYIEMSDENDKKLQDITTRYTKLNDQVARYVELSGKYDTLSDEEKGYVKQMGDELKAAGIVGQINDITGAWEGTEEQLKKTINQQMNLIKINANEDFLEELYKEHAKLQREYDEIIGLYAQGGLEGYIHYAKSLFFTNQSGIDNIQDEIEFLENQIDKTEAQVKYFKNSMNDTEDTMEDVANEAKETAWQLKGMGTVFGSLNGKQATLTLNLDDNKYRSSLAESTNRLSEFVKNNGVTTAEFKGNTTDLFSSIGFAGDNLDGFENAYSTVMSNVDADYSGVITGTSNAGITFEEFKRKYGSIISELNLDVSSLQNLPSINLSVDIDTSDAKKALEALSENLILGVDGVKKSIRGSFTPTESIKKISRRAVGGFVDEGQLFIANEAGPELIGNIGNRTAVANSDQITQAITQAVAPAVYNAVVSAMQSTRGGNSDVVVNIDGKQVFRAVQKQANNYTAQTGKAPFII